MALQAHMRTSLTQEQKWDLCGKARRHRAIKPSGAVYGLQSIWPTKKPEIRTCSLYADTSDETSLNAMPMGSKTFSKWDAIGRKRYRAWLWNKRCSSRYAGGTMRGHRKATLCCMALGEIGAHPSNGACKRPGIHYNFGPTAILVRWSYVTWAPSCIFDDISKPERGWSLEQAEASGMGVTSATKLLNIAEAIIRCWGPHGSLVFDGEKS